jgi:hypothetical protein
VIGHDGGGGCGERLVIQDEGGDQAAVDAADPAGGGQVTAELPDEIAEHEHPGRG